MKHVEVKTRNRLSRIETLYRMLDGNFTMDKIAEWLDSNKSKYSIPLIKKTFREAKKENLLRFFIKEEDIKTGDKIKSRTTGRVGKVTGIKNDGDTIIVKWDTGGSQLLSKEMTYKLSGNDFSKVHTELDPYKDVL